MHMPVLASEHGKDVDLFIYYVHALMAALFIGWMAYFVWVLVKFRKAKSAKASYEGVTGHASSWIEGVVVLVEAVLLLAFAIPLWGKQVDAKRFPDEKEATVIRVTAQQFAWNGRYPGKDGVFGKRDVRLISGDNPFGMDNADPAGKDDFSAPMNDIWVPLVPIKKDGKDTFKPVVIHLTSMDVIHSLSIHPMRICQDAIPGISIPLHFTPTVPGRYMITCAQLCGNSHAYMRGFFTVAKQADYDKWVAEKSATAGGATSFE